MSAERASERARACLRVGKYMVATLDWHWAEAANHTKAGVVAAVRAARDTITVFGFFSAAFFLDAFFSVILSTSGAVVVSR